VRLIVIVLAGVSVACREPAAPKASEEATPAPIESAAPPQPQATPTASARPAPSAADPNTGPCRRDADCVVSVFAWCCTQKEPYAVLRSVERARRKACEGIGQCIDIEGLEFDQDRDKLVARCRNGACEAVSKRR
jgi:hypothetical protein